MSTELRKTLSKTSSAESLLYINVQRTGRDEITILFTEVYQIHLTMSSVGVQGYPWCVLCSFIKGASLFVVQ